MAVLIASDLRKDLQGDPLFRGISFKLEPRDRMTLSGRNGAGKTTLLRMLAGEESIDGGELVFAKGAKVKLHDQRPPRERDITLRDYILSGAPELLALEERLAGLELRMADGDYAEATLNAYADAQAELEAAGGYTWREEALATLNGLGFNAPELLERRLDTFSGGELTRASLARALAGKPDLLLLDEPTNHLDIASLEWLESHLVSLDAAIVIVAHDRWFLESVATSVLELEAGRAKFFPGTWHQWRKEKAARELALGRAIERQQAEIDKLERFVARFSAGTRARQAQSRAKRLAGIDRVTRDPRERESLAFAFKPPERSGRIVFEFSDGRMAIGERTLLDQGELWLERGEHVTLVGPNGAGKTTLIETLAGARPFADDGSEARDATGMALKAAPPAAVGTPAATDGGPQVTGRLSTGHNVKIGFLSQHADSLGAGSARTVIEAAVKRTGLPPGQARALLGRFLFSGEDAEKPLEGLSGGERQRLQLAILVQSGANVLILDEPTNHLDIDSREALEDALAGFQGSLLLISHDRALLDAVGTRTIALEDQTLRSYVGGWPEYLRVRAEREAEAAEAKAKKARPARAPTPARPPARPAAAQASRLEAQIAAAEAELAAIEAELVKGWSVELGDRYEAAKAKVEGLYAKYERVAG
ncbi:ABC-F family ATP-binding cassette domain-containing protein [Conexibacter sp. DBS9H8]|uniref:ABC-F family ATP-binding cassette domain-containing protein n=1 Tax=Conexibacter sp. DBS9H8 TaxID=2937801 RepID=UPI00200DB510|nr:ABC-F family ATP-binding cassette domain-containing protein [Conexibacter sp. DBS9H8]